NRTTATTVGDSGEDALRGAFTTAQRKGPHIEYWKIADLSATGYCLLWENSAASAACVGELVALVNQEVAQEAWQLGVIRWMKFDPGHGLELGVQMLAPGAQAVWAYVRNDDVGRNIAAIDRMQGILLPGVTALGQRDSLILPCLPFRTGCSSILELGTDTQEIVLTRQLENTGRFAQYHYAVQDGEPL
ncbi:MAG: hypothetical protein R3308_04320, partial [Thiohalobacterales bacterium]|nr:hypothetical protein [Thiohalobacterales bacterium]